MTKPTGPLCNLDCTYCFYLEKENLYPDKRMWEMPPEVLEQYVRDYIAAQEVPEVVFAWQGGEPTLLGVDFFRRAVELQKQYADGKTIRNAFQTNGVLIDDEWAEFLAEDEFLVGVSIDGPRKQHDKYRVDKGGRSSFDRVMRGINTLKKHGAEFNTLTVVQRDNSKHPLEVYRFLKEIGSGFIQFIPIVERIAEETGEDGLALISPDSDVDARVSPWTVNAEQYGKFLCAVFDEWVRRDVGETFVQLFDVTLEAFLGLDPSLCVFSKTCGAGLAMEHNGDLYSCDHFVYPENKLGNIMDDPISSLVNSEQQWKFGLDKRDTLPKYCLECDVRFACNGECPKHRFIDTPDGEPGLNYLCAGYQGFFRHVAPYMQYMAGELRAQRPAANIMRELQRQEMQAEGRREPRANDPCLCGSGKKFKKCCGRSG
jgi:uncharacterized protein